VKGWGEGFPYMWPPSNDNKRPQTITYVLVWLKFINGDGISAASGHRMNLIIQLNAV
jgi:hypothetical protein